MHFTSQKQTSLAFHMTVFHHQHTHTHTRTRARALDSSKDASVS